MMCTFALIMATNKDNKSEVLTIRVTAGIKKQLEIMADKDGRTVSNLIQKMIDDFIKIKR